MVRQEMSCAGFARSDANAAGDESTERPWDRGSNPFSLVIREESEHKTPTRQEEHRHEQDIETHIETKS